MTKEEHMEIAEKMNHSYEENKKYAYQNGVIILLLVKLNNRFFK